MQDHDHQIVNYLVGLYPLKRIMRDYFMGIHNSDRPNAIKLVKLVCSLMDPPAPDARDADPLLIPLLTPELRNKISLLQRDLKQAAASGNELPHKDRAPKVAESLLTMARRLARKNTRFYRDPSNPCSKYFPEPKFGAIHLPICQSGRIEILKSLKEEHGRKEDLELLREVWKLNTAATLDVTKPGKWWAQLLKASAMERLRPALKHPLFTGYVTTDSFEVHIHYRKNFPGPKPRPRMGGNLNRLSAGRGLEGVAPRRRRRNGRRGQRAARAAARVDAANVPEEVPARGRRGGAAAARVDAANVPEEVPARGRRGGATAARVDVANVPEEVPARGRRGGAAAARVDATNVPEEVPAQDGVDATGVLARPTGVSARGRRGRRAAAATRGRPVRQAAAAAREGVACGDADVPSEGSDADANAADVLPEELSARGAARGRRGRRAGAE
jgi:hypothetical protein